MKRMYILTLALFTLACSSTSLFGVESTRPIQRVAVLDQMLTATAAAANNQPLTGQVTVTTTNAEVVTTNNNDSTNNNDFANRVVPTLPPTPQDTPTMTYNSKAFATAVALEEQVIVADQPSSEGNSSPAVTTSATPQTVTTSNGNTPSANVTTPPTSTSKATTMGSPTPTPTPSATLQPGVLPTLTTTPTPSATPTLIPTQPAASPKKGLGVVGGQFACADMEKLRASWYHNWNFYPDNSCNKGAFIPRIYNGGSLESLDQIMEAAKASGWAMGFTEPNLSWQANMTPGEGAEAWHQIEEAAAKAGVKLVSPTPNQFEPGQQEPYGHQWTWAMVAEYEQLYGKKPHFDAIGWNIYRSTPERAKSYLTARHQEALDLGYNVPVWVLEYGGECWNTATGKTGNDIIMADITVWLDQTDWIARYAWFASRLAGHEGEAEGWQSCTLINPQTGELTPLGQMYQAR